MIRWIRAHADPDECLAILLAPTHPTPYGGTHD